jgi:hypothetical protein
MAIVVEDGSGLANAETYISVADATSYFTKRGKGDAWDEVEDKEAALRLATEYMLAVYRPLWAGARVTDTQALDWPRVDVPRLDSAGGYRTYPSYYAQNVVPEEVKRACAELALKTPNGDLLIDQEARQVKREKVGPLETEYFDGASGGEQIRYPMVDAMLQMLLSDEGNGYSAPIARA